LVIVTRRCRRSTAALDEVHKSAGTDAFYLFVAKLAWAKVASASALEVDHDNIKSEVVKRQGRSRCRLRGDSMILRELRRA
jgi:hypothetical protein